MVIVEDSTYSSSGGGGRTRGQGSTNINGLNGASGGDSSGGTTSGGTALISGTSTRCE